MKKKKVAIACQGGGSQTAFTAGVLKSFFSNGVHKKHEIVSLSGTSGGAVCATLAWYGLLKAAKGDKTPIEGRLEAFWRDNSTQNVLEEMLNDTMVGITQMVGEGILPEWKTGPYSPVAEAVQFATKSTFPRFYDFRKLLETHIHFDEIDQLITPSSPVLLIGAANVLSGEFKKFSSLKNEITIDALLASTAVPSLFPAVRIGKEVYWDGLFSDNPPTDELIQTSQVGPDRKPDELWVIQVDPKTRDEVPTAPEEILDRRSEMIGNESLFQDLQHIGMVNRFLREGAFTAEYLAKHNYKQIGLFTIPMSQKFQKTLDFSSKLNRKSSYIHHLIEDGEHQGQRFLDDPALMRYEAY